LFIIYDVSIYLYITYYYDVVPPTAIPISRETEMVDRTKRVPGMTKMPMPRLPHKRVQEEAFSDCNSDSDDNSSRSDAGKKMTAAEMLPMPQGSQMSDGEEHESVTVDENTSDRTEKSKADDELSMMRSTVAKLVAEVEEMKRESSTTKKKKKKKKKERDEVNPDAKDTLEGYCTDQMISRALGQALNKHMKNECVDARSLVGDVVASTLYPITFPPGPEEFKSGVGKLYAPFRRYALHFLVEEMRVAHPVNRTGKDIVLVDGAEVGSLLDSISKKHEDEGHSRALHQSGPGDSTYEHDRDLKTVEQCRKLSHLFVPRLYTCRRAARYRFTKDIGYIFWGWDEEYKALRKTLKVWAYEGKGPDGEVVRLYALNDIIDVPVLGGKKEEVTPCIENWRRNHYAMSYYIQHDIEMYVAKKNKVPVDRRVMTRAINLIDIALTWCTVSLGFENNEQFVTSSKDAFRTVYAVALFLRGFMEKMPRMYTRG